MARNGRSSLSDGWRADLARRGIQPQQDAAPSESQQDAEVLYLPPPLSMVELNALEDPPERWIANGIVPANSNVLVVGAPKTHKTNLLLDLALSVATGGAFLQKFQASEPQKVGLVLMEGSRSQIKRRLQRIADAHDTPLSDVENLYCWLRPDLHLMDESRHYGDVQHYTSPAFDDLATYVKQLQLDVLAIDCWAYVASGDSRNEDDVVRQLKVLSMLRDRVGRDLTVILLHHTRKGQRESERDPGRLSEEARGSSAFGGWYDAGLLLTRSTATAPVRVDVELRDYPSPDAFSFSVEDEFPATEDTWPSGFMRLRALDEDPVAVARDAIGERYVSAVQTFLRENPGCSKSELEKGIKGDNIGIRAAFDLLCTKKQARAIRSGRNRTECYPIEEES
ncbi:hypothetical protein BH23GEM9_BH23GEM9_13840 [soil metagenome]